MSLRFGTTSCFSDETGNGFFLYSTRLDGMRLLGVAVWYNRVLREYLSTDDRELAELLGVAHSEEPTESLLLDIWNRLVSLFMLG